MRHAILLIPLIAAFLAAGEDGNLLVTVPGLLPGEPRKDLEIELARRGGTFQAQGWIMQQFSYGLDDARITGQKTAGASTVVQVAVRIRKDCWRPEVEAVLELTLAGDGGKAKGSLQVDGAASPIEADCRVVSRPAWPEPVGTAGSGHPRLVLRPSDLLLLKERLATSAGAPILARLRQAAAVRYAGKGNDSKFRAWPAVACGMLFHLTGEKDWAAQAQTVIEASLKDDGGQDIHMAPRLCGMALAYDLLASVWNDAFRQRVAADLRRRITQLDLTGGFPHSANLASGSNHNGIRLGSLGVAALALLGDGPDSDLERLLADMQRRIRHHLEVGYGETGMYLEGRYYKSMTLERCLGPFLWAHRQALGGRIEGNGLTDWYWLGDEVLAAQPGFLVVQPNAYAKEGTSLTSVALVLGGTTVRRDHIPVLRWLLDQHIARDFTTPLTAAHREGDLMAAIWLPIAFPWDAVPRSPGEVLPPLLIDRRYHRVVLRPAYGTDTDATLVLNPKIGLIRQGHERGGWNAGVQLFTTGGPRVDGSWLPVVKGIEKAVNGGLGGTMLAMRQDGERRLSMEIILDQAFYQDPKEAALEMQKEGTAKQMVKGKDENEDGGAVEEPGGRALAEKLMAGVGGKAVVEIPQWGFWIDHGVRARRAIAVDATDPKLLLVAIRDRVWIAGGEQNPVLTLDVPLSQRDLSPSADGARFTIGAAPGILAGLVVSADAKVETASTSRSRVVMEKGKPPKRITESTWSLTLSGRGTLLTVLALGGQNAPAISAQGGAVSIAGRKLKIDGDRLAWE